MQDRKTIYRNTFKISHFALCVFFAGFFIYAGVKKFIPKSLSGKPVNNEVFVKAFEENRFESPVTFRMAIKSLKASGFLSMVGVLQILGGILVLIPPTRLIGLLILLPIVINIFCFHFFMDNRVDENIETGLLLLLNLLLITSYYENLKSLVVRSKIGRLNSVV